jgi:hypothetical protein
MKFKAQEIANLIWSFATLNVEASSMIRKFTPFIVQMCSNDNGEYTEESIARYIKRQEVANLAWSCAVLGEYPDNLMPLLYTALFGRDCKGDPDYLKKVYGDDGIQKQTIMTMFYVSALFHWRQQLFTILIYHLQNQYRYKWLCKSKRLILAFHFLTIFLMVGRKATINPKGKR